MNPHHVAVYEMSIYNNVEANNHHGARKSHHILTDAVAWNALNLINENLNLLMRHSVILHLHIRQSGILLLL